MGEEQIIKLRAGMVQYLPTIDEYSEILQRKGLNFPAPVSILSHKKSEIKEAIEWWIITIFLARHSEEILTEISDRLGDEFKSSIMSDEYVDALNASYILLAYFINDNDAVAIEGLRYNPQEIKNIVEINPTNLAGIADDMLRIFKEIRTEFEQLKDGIRQKLSELVPEREETA